MKITEKNILHFNNLAKIKVLPIKGISKITQKILDDF